jgi:hypothetical protein
MDAGRLDPPDAAAARDTLERLLGQIWGRTMWIDVCGRAGVSPRAELTSAELRRVAGELAEVPGPASVVGRTLGAQVRAYECLRRAAAAA